MTNHRLSIEQKFQLEAALETLMLAMTLANFARSLKLSSRLKKMRKLLQEKPFHECVKK